jgi:hypothetical protein
VLKVTCVEEDLIEKENWPSSLTESR